MTRTPADGGQLEDEPQPPGGRGPGPEAGWTLSDKKHDYAKVEVVVCRRSPTCAACRRWSTATGCTIKYGAQDVSVHDDGAYTGEISAAMLAKLGCSYVVVGHSERREHHGETTRSSTPRRARPRRGHDADRLRRRGSRGPAGRRARRLHARRRSTDRSRASLPSRSPAWSSPTSRCGPSAPVRSPRPRTRRRCARPSGRGSREVHGDEAAAACGSCTAARSRRRTSPASWTQPDVDGCLVGGASLQADEFGGICRFYDMPVL